MPKLKSLLAGVAISSALSGGMVAVGAMTSAANAETGVGTNSSVLAGGCGHRHHCGWGWGGHWRHHHHRQGRIRVKLHVHNNNHTNNHNDNRRDIDIKKRGLATTNATPEVEE